MVKSREKWFRAGDPLNWSKDAGQAKRRASALASRKGNFLKVAKALQALANVTRDEETRRKARADALYFYRQHNKQVIAKQKGKKPAKKTKVKRK